MKRKWGISLKRFALNSNLEEGDIIEKVKRVSDFLFKSDYDFFKEIKDESIKEEFEISCQEFPEARVFLINEYE